MAADEPGFFRLALARLRAPYERALLDEASARNERLSIEASNKTLQEIARRVEPETDGWIPIGKLGVRDMDEGEALSLRDAARTYAAENPHAIGYLRSLRRFVLGQGVQVQIEHDDPEMKKAVAAWFAEFYRWNNWDNLEDEIPNRAWRDGEVFVRRFDAPPEAQVSSGVQTLLRKLGIGVEDLVEEAEAPPEGMIFLRLVPPEEVADPSGMATHGILTAEGDVCTVLGYCWCTDGKNVRAVIPAHQLLHVKLGVDSDVKRGRSVLAPLLKRFKQFEDWLNYRIILNLMRTAVVLVKTISGTPAQVTALREGQAKRRETPGNDRQLQMLKPGTTVHATAGVSYEFKNPSINAPDAKDDGRAILLTLAAATGLAEYMITGDASNANFASTMVAESPAVREFENWQDFFTPAWVQIHRWALVAGAKARAIEGLTEEQARTLPLTVEWPPLLARDELQHAQANSQRFKDGVLSREGYARDEGIDWDIELERIAKEAGETLNIPIDQLLDRMAQATTAGIFTPDPALEAWARKRLGIPALVGEENPEDLPPLPPRDEPAPPTPRAEDDEPRESRTGPARVTLDVNVRPGGEIPALRQLRVAEITRDDDGNLAGALMIEEIAPAREDDDEHPAD